MKLINDVLADPMKTGVLTVGACAATHFFFALDLLVTGGIGVIGALLTYKAHSNNG